LPVPTRAPLRPSTGTAFVTIQDGRLRPLLRNKPDYASTALHGADYWPNSCFTSRPNACCGYTPAQEIPPLPAPCICRLDSAKPGSGSKNARLSGPSANNTTGYSVYFSTAGANNRTRTHRTPVVGTNALTGCYGSDIFTTRRPMESEHSLDQGRRCKETTTPVG